MFDSKGEFAIPIQGEPPKKVVVRFPTDSEFTAWRRKKKVLQRGLGRDKFQLEASKPEACDLELVTRLFVDKESAPTLDEFEANHVLNRLTECEVPESPDREGSAFVLNMKVMRKLRTTHKLRVPSVKEQMEYERMRSSVIFGKHNQQEIKVNFQASGELYDKLKVEATGYANDIPICHKAEAINVLLQSLAVQDEEAPDEDDEDQD